MSLEPQSSALGGRFPSRDVFFGTSADIPRVVEIDIANIVPNPEQPRKFFDDEKLRELADSISAKGLLHPIHIPLPNILEPAKANHHRSMLRMLFALQLYP